MQIYLAKNGQTLGPFEQKDLLVSIQRGELKADTFAWFDGAADWMPIKNVPGFEHAFAPPPQPQAPPAMHAAPAPSSVAATAASAAAVLGASTASVGSATTNSTAASASANTGIDQMYRAPSSKVEMPFDRGGAPNHAGFWKRFVAIIIDNIILAIAQWVLLLVIALPLGMMVATGPEAAGGAAMGLLGLTWILQIVSWIVYFGYFHSSASQATPGKMALGLIVTNAQQERISFMHAVGRELGKILSMITLYIGFMMAGFTKNKQGLHDMVAGTYVIHKDPNAGPMPRWAIVLLVVILMIFPIAILLAIAIPAYHDYVQRARGFQSGAVAPIEATNVVPFAKDQIQVRGQTIQFAIA